MLEKLLDDIDIVEVISQFVAVRKHGFYYIGVCPFHNEKTGSFTICQKKKIFKCFGCGLKGNLADFIIYYNRKKEDLDKPPTWQEYIDACEYLMEYSKA